MLGLAIRVVQVAILVLTQMVDTIHPVWYYGAGSFAGLISWMAVALSALSDVMPPRWRAPSFGIVLSGFALGLGFSPVLALTFTHFQVSILSVTNLVGGLILSIWFLPETLPENVMEEAARMRAEEPSRPLVEKIWTFTIRPVKEMSILNRSNLFRMVSALAFFSGMAINADQTLVVYYVEDRLAFNDSDIALMFVLIGVMGIFVQAVLLKPFNDCLGEKMVVATAFAFGAIQNAMYGLAQSKNFIFVAVVVGSLSGMAFPTISAIKSNNVNEAEQGRIQGALVSLQALAGGLGPVSLRYVYHLTKDYPYPGPGTMFLFAAMLFVVAIGFAFALPKEAADSRTPTLEEGLIPTSQARYGSTQ